MSMIEGSLPREGGRRGLPGGEVGAGTRDFRACSLCDEAHDLRRTAAWEREETPLPPVDFPEKRTRQAIENKGKLFKNEPRTKLNEAEDAGRNPGKARSGRPSK